MGSGTADEIDIDSLDEATLMALNEGIGVRLQFLHRQETAQALNQAKIGDRVMFEAPNGTMASGIVIRRNRKTVTIHADDHGHWNVSPQLIMVAQDDIAALVERATN